MVERCDVFISYARGNRATAERVAAALEREGIRVWWDRDLPAGSEFSSVIETRLEEAKVVVALWSHESVRSAFVRDESARALRAGKLLPLRIDDVELPLGFGQIHTLDLIDWSGETRDTAFAAVLGEVRRMQGRSVAPAPTRALPRRWKPQRFATAIVLALGLALLGWGASTQWERRQADEHFRAGIAYQHAKEPELESARNEFLTALEHRSGHARARFYLARIYVLQDEPTAALEAYRLALASDESPLDSAQRNEATRQVAALSIDPTEVAPVARAVSPSVARAEEPPRTPPHSEPPDAMRKALAEQVDEMFGENRERRITATTSLVVDPEAISDAVPLAVAKALDVLRAGAAAPGDASGIVNTLVLLQTALPGTLQSHRAQIVELLAATRSSGETTRAHAARVRELLELAATRRAVTFIQIANEAQRPIATALAARFERFGYDSPGIELVGNRAPSRIELRVQGKSDRGFARWLERVVGEIADRAPAVVTLRNASPKVDTYEIWLDRALCAPGGRMLPACSAA